MWWVVARQWGSFQPTVHQTKRGKRKEELTRGTEGRGVDCRTIGARWARVVHDRQERPEPAATMLGQATCREVVGLWRSGERGCADR